MLRGTASIVACVAFAWVSAACDARAASTGVPQQLRPFAQALSRADAGRVADYVRFPMPRPHPLPPVRDARDFIERFEELLPRELREAIVRSAADEWAEVGWRGTMFQGGRLWFDDAGRLYASNELSDAEHRRRLALIARDRESLHASLRKFDEPLLRWQTARYRVRVDRMPDGELRYASWRRDARVDARPDLVLHDGEHRVEGTVRNEYYTFSSGEHRYICAINRSGPADAPPLALSVTRGDEVLLDEVAERYDP